MADYNRRVTELYCTGEEQAGPDAGQCPKCQRMTLHQYTGEPMCGCAVTETEGL